jgi:hypothetical protein
MRVNKQTPLFALNRQNNVIRIIKTKPCKRPNLQLFGLIIVIAGVVTIAEACSLAKLMYSLLVSIGFTVLGIVVLVLSRSR